MRVVFAPSAYTPAIGGSETYTRGLAETVARAGTEAHIVVADIATAAAYFELGHTPTRLGRETSNGVTVHRIPLLPKRKRPASRRRTAEAILAQNRHRFDRNFRRQLARLDPDVVVALPHLFPNVEEAVRLRGDSRWRLIYAPHLHEEDPWWPADRVAEAVQRCDGIIALTEYERERLVAAYGAHPARVAVIPPAVVVPAAPPATDREPTVLFVGRRSASKRIDALVAAMKIVWESLPTARLVVAGSPWMQTLDPLDEIRLDPRVEIRNTVAEAERGALMAAARVVASASVIEAFGITTLEAWAQCTPVVVADTGVSRSIVRHGVDGLVGDRSPEGLAEQLLVLLRDPTMAAALGRAGRLRVESEFTWERSGTALRDLIAAV